MLLLLWGAARLWLKERITDAGRLRAIVAAMLIGAGGFNSYDGIVQHVMLHLRLVNEQVCGVPNDGRNSIATCQRDVPYEMIWIALALSILTTGVTVWLRAYRDDTPVGAR